MKTDWVTEAHEIGKRARANIRSLYVTTSQTKAFKDDDEGYQEFGIPIKEGSPIWAAVEDDESRILEGRAVKAVLFTFSQTWLWMPRSEFDRVARKTSAPEPRFNTFP